MLLEQRKRQRMGFEDLVHFTKFRVKAFLNERNGNGYLTLKALKRACVPLDAFRGVRSFPGPALIYEEEMILVPDIAVEHFADIHMRQ